MVSAKKYLTELKKELQTYVEQLKSLTDQESHKKLDELLKKMAAQEEQLRKDSEIDDRYNLIRNQIQNLVKTYSTQEQNIEEPSVKVEDATKIQDDEQHAYVYLFNAQGANITSWHKLLIASSLEEHSINRPIYVNENHLKKILSTKLNTVQHGYLSVIIKKSDILHQYNANNEPLMDGDGYQLLRLKENAITPDRIEYFWHEGKKYRVLNDGILKPF